MRKGRRKFLSSLAALGGAAGAASARAAAPAGDHEASLPRYARAQSYRSLKQSSYDRKGGNADRYQIPAGGAQEVFSAKGPGVVTHMWFTIASPSLNHLKEIVLRAYWDDERQPSIEAPIGDFFGLNLGQYFVYQSAYLNCSSIKALNCYLAMPFRRSGRITATNEGERPVNAFYVNIDYQLVPALPDDALYLHAQYRQAAANEPTTNDWKTNGDANRLLNLDGKRNYVFCEARGRGHLMGVTLGILQNQEYWAGEGDEMIFLDDEEKPAITGTGTEDYICGAWDFGGRDAAVPFAHLYNGAPFIAVPERTGGRYCLYRWHGDNPVTFTRYLRHTIEHGHANHRADNFYSCCYWYQTEPHLEFPALAPLAERIPVIHKVAGPGGAA
ncbi:MAG TPA: glycoside hydrolase family 172 protein [Bryobacterales bacterium]|nr:glycoside hydrolase family 172 protein [Bryobacterales bacterium]